MSDHRVRQTPMMPPVRLDVGGKAAYRRAYLARVLVLARMSRGLTGQNIAERLGYIRTTVANRELGKAVGGMVELVDHLDACEYAVVVMPKGQADALCDPPGRPLPDLADLPTVFVPSRPGRG